VQFRSAIAQQVERLVSAIHLSRIPVHGSRDLLLLVMAQVQLPTATAKLASDLNLSCALELKLEAAPPALRAIPEFAAQLNPASARRDLAPQRREHSSWEQSASPAAIPTVKEQPPLVQ